MGFNLGGVGVVAQSQLFDKLLGIGLPVNIAIGGEVGIVVTHGTVDFTQQGDSADLVNLALQSIGNIGQLLAHSGR